MHTNIHITTRVIHLKIICNILIKSDFNVFLCVEVHTCIQNHNKHKLINVDMEVPEIYK